MVENLDFDELEGASITEKRRAINLAYRRHSWLQDKQHLKNAPRASDLVSLARLGRVSCINVTIGRI